MQITVIIHRAVENVGKFAPNFNIDPQFEVCIIIYNYGTYSRNNYSKMNNNNIIIND